MDDGLVVILELCLRRYLDCFTSVGIEILIASILATKVMMPHDASNSMDPAGVLLKAGVTEASKIELNRNVVRLHGKNCNV